MGSGSSALVTTSLTILDPLFLKQKLGSSCESYDAGNRVGIAATAVASSLSSEEHLMEVQEVGLTDKVDIKDIDDVDDHSSSRVPAPALAAAEARPGGDTDRLSPILLQVAHRLPCQCEPAQREVVSGI